MTPDIAGNYWASDAPVPVGIGPTETVTGTAMLIDAERTEDGQLISGVVRVDLGLRGLVDFKGPIGCA